MYKKLVCILVLIPFLILVSGCCSIIRGNREMISIDSVPSGAKVSIDGLKGTTPYSASLARDKDYVATVSKEGYQSQQVQITKSFSPLAIFGNIFFLLIGAIVDICTGSAYNLNPIHNQVELEKA